MSSAGSTSRSNARWMAFPRTSTSGARVRSRSATARWPMMSASRRLPIQRTADAQGLYRTEDKMGSRRDFMTKASGAVVGAAGLIVAQAGPAVAQESTVAGGKSKLDEVLARGKIIVGVTSEAPPFGFIDDKSQLVGFDIDIAKLMAKEIFGDENKIEL